MISAQPPLAARALLLCALPRDVRDAILLDLDEVYQRRVDADGVTAARRWYWREAMSFTWRFVGERLLPRRPPLQMSMLDVKIAAHIITKYPGLTIIGGLAIATAIGVTVVGFEVAHDLSNPILPLPDGDRVVSVQMWDGKLGAPESRLMFELARWREAQSFESIGGYDTVERTLVAGLGEGELVRAAEMSAAGFHVAAIAPLLGRTLLDRDEVDGAPPVIVIGYRVWTSKFDADPNIVGKTLHLGSVVRTIVGVMPDGFGFPVAHSLWIPLRPQPTVDRFTGPALRVFARLSSSATLASAQSELAAVSARQPWPAHVPTARPLTPRVMAYASGIVPFGYIRQAYLLQSVLILLLVICCGNVAALVFARTATRQNEIIVRTALGAGRGRILGQFFVEALVLATIGSAFGLFVANTAIQWAMKLIWSTGSPRPFWWDDRIAPVTYLYVGALTLLVAVLCGIMPALKGTRAGVHAGLQHGAGRAASLSFGFGWTAVIMLQVALCVALLPAALSQGWDAIRAEAGGAGFATSEYLSVTLDVEPGSETRRSALYKDLEARVRREPDVRGVAFAGQFPGMTHPRGPVDVDGDAMTDRITPQSYAAVVAPGFFEALGVMPIAGRTFVDADVAGRQVAVVNRLFVDHVLGGRHAIGQRVRFAANGAPRPWMEIIGVVPNLGMSPLRPEEGMGLYLPAAPGENGVESMAVHVARDAAAFSPRLRAIALDVSPVLQLKAPMPLNVVGRADQIGFRFFAVALAVVGVIGIVLSAAAIYALMSFTVSRRMREIAISAALGANTPRIVAEIFTRVLQQVGLGAIAGVVMVLVARPQTAREVWLPVSLGLFMLVIGLCACAVPARRALRIQPSDALKDLG